MTALEAIRKEFEQEAQLTRKMLERVPDDKFDWKPHEKNMPLRVLAGHVAELSSWISMAFNTDELDFAANPYVPPVINSKEDLLKLFEQSTDTARADLASATEADMEPRWTLREGENIFMVYTKGEVVRHSMSQTIHHRAQLGIYLRLLDIAVPATYGPSADEM